MPDGGSTGIGASVKRKEDYSKHMQSDRDRDKIEQNFN